MKVKTIIHEADEGGYWAEVLAIPGCATQGETFEELLLNLYYEAIEGCLSIDLDSSRSLSGTGCSKSRFEGGLRQGAGRSVGTAPIHGSRAVKEGLLRHLLKVAELSEEDL